jgi:hypothetical protein
MFAMRRPSRIDAKLTTILRESARVPMTAEGRVRQAVSLAYGNLKMEDDGATRAQVSAATEAVFAADLDPSLPQKRTAARR